MIPTMARFQLASLLAAALLAGCASDDEGIVDLGGAPGGALLVRYVSLGNSITAGFQSGGLTDSLQLLAYPALVARQAGVPFNLPLLRDPGCPPPFITTIFVQPTPRLGGLPADRCAFLDEDALRPGPIQNVAAVGASITGAIDPSVGATPPDADVYRTLLLGDRSQLRAMADADPTFVSVWLGNNETLATALSGDPSLLLSLPRFEAALDSVVRGIRNTRARGAVLIAPINALSFAPRFQPGAWFFLARAAGLLPKPVAPDCAPGTEGGRSLVALDAVVDPGVGVIGCAETAPYVNSPTETAAFAAAVDGYRAAIQDRATRNSWIYLDPDSRFAADLADPAKNRKCQGLSAATTAAQLAAAVLESCPSPAEPFFGSWISFDATHPSTAAQYAIANALIEEINAKHGLQIAPISP